MLIRNARLLDGQAVDVSIAGDQIVAICPHGAASSEEVAVLVHAAGC